MKKYEVTVEVNRANGYRTFGVEANSKEEALQKFCVHGEIIREDYELDWNGAYGEEPDPIVEEVEEFSSDYYKGLEQKMKYREELFEKILVENVVLSELRDIYRRNWKLGKILG